MGSQAGQMYLNNRGSFVSKITVQSLTFLIGISGKKDIKQYVIFEITTRYSAERHFIPNWNFMLKTSMMLIVTSHPGISILCSSSSYKIINVKNILFQIGILCRKQRKNDEKLFVWLELFDV